MLGVLDGKDFKNQLRVLTMTYDPDMIILGKENKFGIPNSTIKNTKI